MAFDHRLECDQTDEPSFIWKLPLLLLTILLKQIIEFDGLFGHTLILADSNNSCLRSTNTRSITSSTKWEPSLFTINEEENPSREIGEHPQAFPSNRVILSKKGQQAHANANTVSAAFWQGLWSADFFVTSTQKQAHFLGALSSFLLIGIC
jgi:hypothetical protein